jgi:hypothetical protein
MSQLIHRPNCEHPWVQQSAKKETQRLVKLRLLLNCIIDSFNSTSLTNPEYYWFKIDFVKLCKFSSLKNLCSNCSLFQIRWITTLWIGVGIGCTQISSSYGAKWDRPFFKILQYWKRQARDTFKTCTISELFSKALCIIRLKLLLRAFMPEKFYENWGRIIS